MTEDQRISIRLKKGTLSRWKSERAVGLARLKDCWKGQQREQWKHRR